MEINQVPSQEDKTVAILCYITLIGYIVALVLHSSNKTKLGAYHLRQATGLVIFCIGVWIALFIIRFIPFIGSITLFFSPIFWLAILALLILGIINAASGEEKPLPIVGAYFEKWFSNVFA